MRELKVHLVVDVRRTSPKFFAATSTYVLCRQHNAERITRDRKFVTCHICNHLIKEYGDKCVIERGNAPPAVLSYVESFMKYRAEATRGRVYAVPRHNTSAHFPLVWVEWSPGEYSVGVKTGRWSIDRYRK